MQHGLAVETYQIGLFPLGRQRANKTYDRSSIAERDLTF